MYEEERDELNDQFHRVREYRRTNPDLAVGSTSQLPEFAPLPDFPDWNDGGPGSRAHVSGIGRYSVNGKPYYNGRPA